MKQWKIPRWGRYVKRFPSISLELELNDLHVDILKHYIDLALRTGYGKDSRLIARRLSPMGFLICASPQHLEQHGSPSRAEDFHDHQWIGLRIKETLELQPIFLPDEHGEYLPAKVRVFIELLSASLSAMGESANHT